MSGWAKIKNEEQDRTGLSGVRSEDEDLVMARNNWWGNERLSLKGQLNDALHEYSRWESFGMGPDFESAIT